MGGTRTAKMPQAYREAIIRVVRERQRTDRNLHFLDGLSMVDDPLYLLVTDTVHPTISACTDRSRRRDRSQTAAGKLGLKFMDRRAPISR